MNENHNYLLVTLDRFEGPLAVLVAESGDQFKWPIKNLPAQAQEGNQFKLALFNDALEKEEREKIAKTLLNEILKED